MLQSSEVENFQREVLDYYHEHQRQLPWRQPEFDPYKIMVSEIMLQQTQVTRVIEKYQQFLELFPTVDDLAAANLNEVLVVWQGLGYNRRGRYLREAAIVIRDEYNGVAPRTVEELVRLPGIGVNTANAIIAYAYNQPVVFIETNIRTVYLHHFFKHEDKVADRDILSLVEQTVDRQNPREWYWALMDYGTFIKREHGNPNARSRHYSKQSTFKGSKRQVRGQVVRLVSARSYSIDELLVEVPDPRLKEVIDDLVSEHLLLDRDGILSIAD